jgi:hypothetical protein
MVKETNKPKEKVFTNVREASEYLYGVDDGQVNVGEFKQVRIIFE